MSYPDLTNGLLDLSELPEMIESDNNIMDTLQRFDILTYDRTSQRKDMNKAQKNIFNKNTNVERILLTFSALKQHVRQTIFQGSFIWYQSLVPNPHIPSPLNWGWKFEEDNCYEPLWALLSDAGKACKELISCGCCKGCKCM